MFKYVDSFLHYLKFNKNFSELTIINYKADLKSYFSFTESLNEEEIKKYVNYLMKAGKSASTTSRHIASLKSFAKYLVREKIIANNPTELIEPVKVEKKLPRPVEKDLIIKLINLIDNTRDKAIFEILYGAGLRRSELVTIKIENVNLEENYIFIEGKGRKERIVLLHDKAVSLLKELIGSRTKGYVFEGKKSHLSTRQLGDIVKKWANKAGISLTAHQLRHSFGSHLYENGADIRAIQDLMGHASINTTNQYAKVSMKRNRGEYLKAHPLANN